MRVFQAHPLILVHTGTVAFITKGSEMKYISGGEVINHYPLSHSYYLSQSLQKAVPITVHDENASPNEGKRPEHVIQVGK